ncbi:MAG: hypothetical protein IAG10_20530 [Planctomycetaceae bacterium]|nr:hypothetical protein [Planctomycetaceae bacterium]
MANAKVEIGIWERLIHPNGKMTPTVARAILDLGFSDEERRRMHELAVRNQAGELSEEELEQLDGFCRAGTMLSLLQSRARTILRQRKRSASRP